MKQRLFIFLIALVLSIVMPFSVYASEKIMGNDFLPHDIGVEEMRAEILLSLTAFQSELPRELTLKDIDLSRAYKIHMTNIFDIETNDFKTSASILEKKDNYIFIVPIYFENGDVYVANIQRRNPLPENAYEIFTKDEIDRYEQTVGHWVVSAVSQYLTDEVPFVDYYDIVRDSIIDTGTFPILVGGLSYFNWTIALFPDESGNISRLVPIEPDKANWSGLKNSRQQAFEQNGWLDYSEIKRFISDNPLHGNPNIAGGSTGGGISLYIVLAFVLIFSVFIGFSFYRRRMRNESQ